MWRSSRVLSQKFRLYPSKTVERRLEENLELCRWLYNRLLEELNKAKAEERRLTRKDTQALIVRLKREKPELNTVYSKVLQMVNYQLWSNIRALAGAKRNGRKVGKLRFKGGWFKTLNFNQSGFKLEGKKLLLSKIGAINVKLHRALIGKVKGVIVKRSHSGKWYAVFQVENSLVNYLPETGTAVGLDMGVKHFLSDSNGRQIENPKFYEKSLARLRVAHRVLSRKEKGSKNRAKARVRLARVYERLENQRDDFLHKLSRFYVNNYGVIAVEDLNVKGMVGNHCLARKIHEASWSKFFQMLSYKAENAGRVLVKVNPRGTSKEYKHGELDRDYNAALNILERGLAGLGRPLEPVETKPLLVAIPASLIVEAGSPHPSG
jgi:putative transposase